MFIFFIILLYYIIILLLYIIMQIDANNPSLLFPESMFLSLWWIVWPAIYTVACGICCWSQVIDDSADSGVVTFSN